MGKYCKVTEVDSTNLNALLEQGWEIIETSKRSYGDGTAIIYHIGFPTHKALDMALNLLKLYDKHDFRLQLIENIAGEIGTNVDRYEHKSNRLISNRGDDVTKALEHTDFLLSGVLFPHYEFVNDEEIERRRKLLSEVDLF